MNCTDCMRPARRRRVRLSVTPSTGSESQPLLNAYITLNREAALKRRRPRRRDQASLAAQPFAGVPVVIKDNMCTTGLRTTCGSRILGNYIPPYTATAVRNSKRPARSSSASPISMSSHGVFDRNSGFGPVRNPVDHAYVPGGSSGGSAVAVAAGHDFRSVRTPAVRSVSRLHSAGLSA